MMQSEVKYMMRITTKSVQVLKINMVKDLAVGTVPNELTRWENVFYFE